MDEGILQVTGLYYAGPSRLFLPEAGALGTTSQIVDLILPEFSILRAAATGRRREGASSIHSGASRKSLSFIGRASWSRANDAR